MDDNTSDTDTYHHQCAKVVHAALADGGIGWDKDRPVPANQNGPWLVKQGASAVGQSDNADLPQGYIPQKGDVAVFQGGGPASRTPYGHMEMYDGTQWISDTKQSDFAPSKSYPGGVTVYRFPD